MTTAAPSSDTSGSRKKRRRWILRTLVVLIGIFLIVVGVVQVILWTEMPRNMVVGIIERQLGLRISAKSLSTGWFGHTTLNDVAISLPLADEALAAAPTLRVSHTWLPALLLGGDVVIERITIEQPQVVIRQSAGGRWNVQDAVELIARTVGARNAATRTGQAPSRALPALRIEGGVVRLIDNQSHEAQVAPIEATGTPSGPLRYRYSLRIPDHATAEGEIAPGGLWQHEIKLVVNDVDEWIRPFVARWPSETRLEANWHGRVDEKGALRGRLDLRSLDAGDISASGSAIAQFEGGRLDIHPQRVLVQTGEALAPEIRIDSGTIALDGSNLRAESLRISASDGEAEISGTWNRADGSADLSAQWRDLRMFARRVAHSGTITAALRRPWPGAPKIDATITSSGTLPDEVSWVTQVGLHGEGADLRQLDWIASIGQFAYTSDRETVFRDVVAHLQTRGQVVVLQDVTAGDLEHLTGRGQIDLVTHDWWLWLRGDGNMAARGFPAKPLEFDVTSWGMDLTQGTGQRAHYSQVDKVYLRSGDVEASALGTYDAAQIKPMQLDVWLTHLPDLGGERDDLIRGRLRSEGHLSGTIVPLELSLNGRLFARDLIVNDRPLGDARAAIDGSITRDSIKIQTRRLKLFDGEWDVAADWPSSFPAQALDVSISVTNLSLPQVAELFRTQGVSGSADGNFHFKIDAASVDHVRGTGDIRARDVVARDFAAETLAAHVAMGDGVLRIDPIELHQRDGQIRAAAESSLAAAPAQWQVRGTATQWPVNVDPIDGAARVSGEANAAINLQSRSASGPVTLRAEVARNSGAPLGSVQLAANLEGRTIRLRDVAGTLFGGTLAGSGTYDLDAPRLTTASLECKNVEVAELVAFIPRLDGADGHLDGNIAIAPSDDPRALGPVRLSLTTRSADAHYRGLKFRAADIVAFADLDRIVTDSVKILAADGNVTGFARVSRRGRGADDMIAAQVILDFEDMSLDQVVHAGDPSADPMPGQLGGSLRLAGDLREPAGVFGDVRLTLARSDLANLDAVALLYNLMHVGGGEEPTGHGFIRGRLENNSLNITEGRFFNRGVEIRGIAMIHQIFSLPDCPIDGTLVGSARPLQDIRLPFFADVDQIMAALQANVSTVRISGTVRQPQVRVATFAEIGEQMRKILVGEAKGESN